MKALNGINIIELSRRLDQTIKQRRREKESFLIPKNF